MVRVKQLVGRWSPTSERPSIQRAQLRALARQMPMLYCVLLGTSVSMAVDFAGAPRWLVALEPALLLLIGIVRTLQWGRLDVDGLADADVRQRLSAATMMVLFLATGFTIWSLALAPFASDADARVHLAYCVGIVVLGTNFSLVHLRFAAPMIAAVMVAPIMVASTIFGDLHAYLVAIDLAVVAGVTIVASAGYYHDFRRLNEALETLADLSMANERAALIDSLTGLGNRRDFFSALDGAVARSGAVRAEFLVGLIDLDGFKPINDLHGHAAGDLLLAAAAERLRDVLPPKATCARLGGDEFAFLIPDLSTPTAAEALGAAVCAAIAVPLDLSSAQVRVGASIGMALHPSMGTTREQLVEHADFALYHAKARSRGRAVLFSTDHADKIGAERRLTHALRWADLDRELSLVFQPIVDVVANRVTAFEALARWHSATLGRVPPQQFIPTAERIGLVGAITESLFMKACAVARLWPEPIRLSFNLSGEDLAGPGAAGRLRRMVDASGLSPQRLIFEVTETAVIHDFPGASACLQALRGLGCSIALDDFGTGFSSLSYVHRLPLDKLKIDGSFVRSLADDPASRSIVQTIVDLSAKLGLDCIVEGVERQEQADALRAMGCAAMQGWLFGMPIAETMMLRGDYPVAAFARHDAEPDPAPLLRACDPG